MIPKKLITEQLLSEKVTERCLDKISQPVQKKFKDKFMSNSGVSVTLFKLMGRQEKEPELRRIIGHHVH